MKRIIVLGVLRSGTSITADLARAWGAYAGEEDELWTSGVDDPRGYGYLEYLPLQQLNDELLGGNDRVPIPNELLAGKAAEQVYREKALQLVRSMDKRASEEKAIAWVWKDARLPMTLPFWARFWEDAIYVVTVRHPAETALSAAKTEGLAEDDSLPFSAAFAYWQFCMLNVLSFTQNSPRKLFLAYDRLVDEPQNECARLCAFLDEQCGLPPEGAPARIEAMLSRVSKGQRHYHYGKSLAEMASTKEQRALYDFLRVKTSYPDEAFNEDDFALYPGWQEYLQCVDAMMSMTSGFTGE